MKKITVLTQHAQPEVYSDDNHMTEGSQYASVVSISGSGGVRLAMDEHDDRKRGAAVAICRQKTQNDHMMSISSKFNSYFRNF